METTKGHQSFAILAALLLTAACAPLRQAPLVYTSGVTVGMQVGVSPQDGYAPSVVIGFKMLDAAYVPVGVGRNCESAVDNLYAPTTAQKDSYVYENLVQLCRIETIRGNNATNGNSSSSDPDASLGINEFQRHITALQQIYALRDTLGAEIKKLSDERDRNTLSLQEIHLCEAPSAGAATPAEAVAEAKAADTSEPAEKVTPAVTEPVIPAQACADSESQKRISQDLTLRQQFIAERIPVAENELSNTLTNADIEQRNLANFLSSAPPGTFSDIGASASKDEVKEDAFSVYGTFNGDAGTNVPTGRPVGNAQPVANSDNSGQANLKVGKVFSTGVASQNLTQGLKAAFVANAATNCFSEANRTRQQDLETWGKMADAAKATAYLETLTKSFDRTLSACTSAAASMSSSVTH